MPLGATQEKAIRVPDAYMPGYLAAREQHPELAEAYIRYTTVGDPLADAVVEDLSDLPPNEVHAVLSRALDDPAELDGAPDSLKAFIGEANDIPDWFDSGRARVASRAFLRNSDIVLAALVGGSIVEGFATLISKSFRIRGRVTQSGVRRLKQNGMQLVEQYLPGGMDPGGDGWRLTLRVRLVHAQSRRLLDQSDEWNHEKYGTPLSAAHILLAGAAFSGRLMQHTAALGGDFTQEERDAYVHVWKYTGLLIGIPEPLLFEDEASAVLAFKVGAMCEPPADYDAIIMANSIVNSAPVIVGITDPAERRKTARVITQACRELIGNELADTFLFPTRRRKVLPWMRFKNRSRRVVRRTLPWLAKKQDLARFEYLMNFASLDKMAYSYKLPTTLYDEDSQDW